VLNQWNYRTQDPKPIPNKIFKEMSLKNRAVAARLLEHLAVLSYNCISNAAKRTLDTIIRCACINLSPIGQLPVRVRAESCGADSGK
jgi:hypothetical protein